MSTTWTIQRTTPPAQNPVTVQKAKQKLRLMLADTSHDDELSRLIVAATEQFEQDTDRAVIEQSFTLFLDYFPSTTVAIPLSVKPVQSITSITYTDSDGAGQTVDPALYVFDSPRREVVLTPGNGWPTTNRQRNNVQILFVAGYGAPANVPGVILEAILCLVAALFYGNSPDAEPYLTAYNHLITNKLRTSYY